MSKLQSLSEQLHPLETAYADVRFYDVDVEQTQQQYENLISLMNFDNRLSDVNKNFQQWYDELVRKKQELEAENNLSCLINDFKQTLVNAENDFEKLDGTMNSLKNFRDMILPMVVEKSDRIRDLILPVKTENIKEFYDDVDKLTDRYNDLSTRVNDKLNHAKEQENVFDDIQQQLDDMEQKVDDFLNKYITSQDLLIAMEDVDQLHSLLDQIPISAIENITECDLKENLLKKADNIKNKIKNLLVPLEKDTKKEQKLMQNVHEILCAITSIGDDVIAVDNINEPSEQLMSIGELAENLRKLKGKVEKLERKLHNPEGMVKHALISDNLYDRVIQLQNALDDKKKKLTDRAKLYSTTAAIDLINKNVNEMEQIPLQTVEEQNSALNELEGKKHELENLLKDIPMNDEGNKLRENGNRLLAQLNDNIKRLTDAVGEKVAALASFNAIKDEIETQLSSMPNEINPFELDHQLCDINDKLINLERLKNKIDDIDERNLDVDKITEKQNLHHTIEKALDHLKVKI
ncbi:hypothetical protein WUBG_14571 [Wuchereria bancrofti]|uniref:Nuclear anchorage protein 1 n=1 Tax=Wuchereria bancrofti TaxID=6293 RepID=J9DXK4_WUCBA|nr:hypothetical protein WUBG_14571 [Wuchereria bancrofti]